MMQAASLHTYDVFTSSFCTDIFIQTSAFHHVFVGQFSMVWTVRRSLGPPSTFNTSMKPIMGVKAAVDDSIIQPDIGIWIHKGRKAFNSRINCTPAGIKSPKITAYGFGNCKA